MKTVGIWITFKNRVILYYFYATGSSEHLNITIKVASCWEVRAVKILQIFLLEFRNKFKNGKLNGKVLRHILYTFQISVKNLKTVWGIWITFKNRVILYYIYATGSSEHLNITIKVAFCWEVRAVKMLQIFLQEFRNKFKKGKLNAKVLRHICY